MTTARKFTRQLLACLSKGARQEPALGLQGPALGPAPGLLGPALGPLGPAPRTYYTYSHEPFHPLKRVPKWQTADEAVAVIKSGRITFLGKRWFVEIWFFLVMVDFNIHFWFLLVTLSKSCDGASYLRVSLVGKRPVFVSLSFFFVVFLVFWVMVDFVFSSG